MRASATDYLRWVQNQEMLNIKMVDLGDDLKLDLRVKQDNRDKHAGWFE